MERALGANSLLQFHPAKASNCGVQLWDDVAPKHVASFLKLTQSGFYDTGAFHRIIPGFVIQGGDPNAKVS